MDPQYLSTLKNLNTNNPKKLKVESKEVILLEQDNQKENEIKKSIVLWFMKNPYPNDDAVHKFASEMGMDEHKFEKYIYAVLSSILSEGESKGKNSNYDPEQIKMGIKVEMEHTTCPTISEKIAWDHLAEIPDYYTRLEKMEKDAGV